MPHNHQWQSRLKAVEREYEAMKQAADRFLQAAFDDPTVLQANARHGEIVVAAKNLEGTYILRLFAEFETGARQYWGTFGRRNPKTLHLLDRLAARCKIPDLQRTNAHFVRSYRNALAHGREDDLEEISIATARGYLCRFFSFLPPHW